MKPATPALTALLNSQRQFVCADVFTITQSNTNEILATTADVPITWDGKTYSPYGIQISGLKYKIIIGLEADEQTVTIASNRDGETLDNLPFLDAIRKGSLDGAKIKRQRVYLETWGTEPVGAITLFTGYVASIDYLGRTHAEIKVKSNLALLDLDTPRRTYQSACLHTLYDSGCGLSKAAWGTNGTVETGSTIITINWTGATSSYFWQGTILFTNGANAGINRTIKNTTGTQVILSYPLPYPPATGDTFTAYAGCDKTLNACKNRFNNLANNTSFPFVPTPETAM